MLARLFNNLSVQSLASALLASFLLIGLAVFFTEYHYTTLVIPGSSFQISPFLFQVAAFILIPVYSVWFNSLLIRQGFMKGHHYLIPFLAMGFWLFGCYENQPAALLAIPLIITLIAQLLRLIIVGTGALQIIFNIGFITGFVSLFFPPVLLFIVLSWVAIMLFGQLNVRTFIIPILGLAALYFMFYAGFFFFTDISFPAEMGDILSRYELREINGEVYSLWPYLLLIIAVLISMLEYIKALNYAKIQKRQFLNFNTALMILGLIAFIAFQSPWPGVLVIAFPVSVLLSNLVQYSAKWWARDLVYLSVMVTLFLVVFQVGNFFG